MKRLLLGIALALIALTASPAFGQTKYYLDFSSGSNSNSGTSSASPWKSRPGMQQVSGCGGATHAYTPTRGDQFIYKGGVTWPAACFGITVIVGEVQSYDGVDKTWYNGASWTRPLWDLTYTGIANGIVYQTAAGDLGSHTVDNIEIAHQLVSLYSGMFDDQEAFKFYYGA